MRPRSHPTPSRRVRALRGVWVAVAVALLTLTAGSSTAVGGESQDPLLAARARLEVIDAELWSARSQMHAWQAELDAWSARLEAAERAVTMLEREARLAGPAPLVLDVLRSGLGRPTVLQVRVAAARRHLARLRGDDAAASALRSIFSLQTTIAGLEARRSIARADAFLFARADLNDPAAAEPDAGTWAKLFLTAIGAPSCADNLIVVLAWQAQEGTSARFNPLATTYDMSGAVAFNSVGVRDYATVAQGLAATRSTLQLPVPSYGYAPILASLRACALAETTAWYVNASAWCRGCADGAYLTGLIPLVRADQAAYAART